MQQDNSALSRVAGILSRFASVDRVRITRDSRLRDEFGINSLSMIDLVVMAEDEFNVRIPDEEAERFETVGDVVDFLQRASVVS